MKFRRRRPSLAATGVRSGRAAVLAVAPAWDTSRAQPGGTGLAPNIAYHGTPAGRTNRHLRYLYQGRRGPGSSRGRSHRP